MITGVGVDVGVGVGTGVDVAVGVGVGTGVDVAVGVGSGVGASVTVGGGTGVCVGSGVGTAVGATVGVGRGRRVGSTSVANVAVAEGGSTGKAALAVGLDATGVRSAVGVTSPRASQPNMKIVSAHAAASSLIISNHPSNNGSRWSIR